MSSQSHTAKPRIVFQKIVNGRRAARFAVSEKTALAVEQILREAGYDAEGHANCRPVMICEPPDMEVYRLRMEKHGAEQIKDFWFPSALAASYHFGYVYNEVAQALSRAERRGQSVAIVAGVPLSWADAAGGSD